MRCGVDEVMGRFIRPKVAAVLLLLVLTAGALLAEAAQAVTVSPSWQDSFLVSNVEGRGSNSFWEEGSSWKKRALLQQGAAGSKVLPVCEINLSYRVAEVDTETFNSIITITNNREVSMQTCCVCECALACEIRSPSSLAEW
jgi:hypothetical protein